MSGFEIDVASLRKFVSAAGDVAGRIGALDGLVGTAALAPGTFTQTTGGRRIDGVHSVLRNRVAAMVNSAAAQVQAGVAQARATADDYDQLDTAAAQELDTIQQQLRTEGGRSQ